MNPTGLDEKLKQYSNKRKLQYNEKKRETRPKLVSVRL